jgi:hypothetical protein
VTESQSDHAEHFDPGRSTRKLGAALECYLQALAPSPLTASWLETAKDMQRPAVAPPLHCYDASFGRVHVRPGCRCPR